MRSSPTRRRGLGFVVGGVLTGVALTGCTSAPAGTATPTPAITSAVPTPRESTAQSESTAPSAAAEPTPSAAPGETSADDGAVTIDITIADGQVTPNGKKLDVEVGQPIVLYVTSDEHDEIHAHTDSDGYELAVKAGTKVTGRFTVGAPGSYEVESHHLEKTIVILNAR